MAIKNTLKKVRIEFGSDGDFVEVRGLGIPDVGQLIDANKAALGDFFDRVTGRGDREDKLTTEDMDRIGQELLTSAPMVAIHIIMLGADLEPSDYEAVRTLPFDVQIAALEAIGRLTVAMSGGAKNLVETVLRMAAGANGLKADLLNPLA